MALYVVKHKTCDELGSGYYGRLIKETGHTYVCGEESEVKKLVEDLNKSICTRFPMTREQENSILSEITRCRCEQGRNPQKYDELRLEIDSLYRRLNDDGYDYWCYELVHFLDVSSARAFLL